MQKEQSHSFEQERRYRDGDGVPPHVYQRLRLVARGIRRGTGLHDHPECVGHGDHRARASCGRRGTRTSRSTPRSSSPRSSWMARRCGCLGPRRIDDLAYVKGLIPHHSIAILTSECADIDAHVPKQAHEIIEAQPRRAPR